MPSAINNGRLPRRSGKNKRSAADGPAACPRRYVAGDLWRCLTFALVPGVRKRSGGTTGQEIAGERPLSDRFVAKVICGVGSASVSHRDANVSDHRFYHPH